MKKVVVLSALCFSLFGLSQEKVDIEKSMFSVQTGLLGIWANHEYRVLKHTAVRSEVGLVAGLWGGSHYNGVGFLMTPLFRIEPRYYYNVDRRLVRQKDIGNNSANFFSLKTTWYPDWFVISNKNIDVVGGVSIIPTYGLRRNINANFNYEISFGLGYQNKFSKNGNESSLLPDVSARIGYTF